MKLIRKCEIACVVAIIGLATLNKYVYSKSCDYDRDCWTFSLNYDYCIQGTCYEKKSHGQMCSFTRQCYETGMICRNSFCACSNGQKFLRGRCALDNECEFDADCPGINQYCYKSGFCQIKFIDWNIPRILGLSFGLTALVCIIIAVEVVRRRRAQQFTQALIRNQQAMPTTTVVQPIMQPAYVSNPQPIQMLSQQQPQYQSRLEQNQPHVATGYCSEAAPPQYQKY